MKSPFAIFRKHARVLTVVLTGLAMFAFVVMDQMRSDPQMFPIVMAGVLLGAAFWILGRPSGHANEYGVGGLLLGVVLMAYVVPNFNRPGAAVELTIGSLTIQDVNDQMRRLQQANQFIGQIRAETKQPGARQRFIFGQDAKDNAAMISILSHEADEMGIMLSDDAINDFINRETGDQLTPEQFKEVRTKMRLSETELYDMLREFLRAELASQLLAPQDYTTPLQFWDYYRRLNVKQEIKVAAVPVKDFLSDKEPDSDRVAAFFDLYKDKLPSRFSSPEPAFMQPRRMRLAYLEVQYNEVREAVQKNPDKKITEKQIADYYEENKDLLYIEPPEDETPPFEPSDPDKPIDPVLAPEPPSADDPPRKEEPTKESKSEKPDTDKPDAPEKSKPKTDGSKEGDGQFSVEDDEAEKQGGTANKDKNEEAADSDAADDTDIDEPPVVAPIPKRYRPLDDELKDEIREELLHDLVIEEVRIIQSDASSFMSNLEFDLMADTDASRDPTAEELAEMEKEVASRVRDYAAKHNLRYVELVEPSKNVPKSTKGKPLPRLKLLSFRQLTEFGKEAAELWNEINGADAEPTDKDHEVLDFLVMQATPVDGVDERRRDEAPSVARVLFSNAETRLFKRDSAQDPISNNHYVYWKLEDKAAELPKLDDPRIRRQVVDALKESDARKPARERATALAERVRKSLENKKTMEEALEGQTVTGKSGSVELTVLDTGESFSWLSIPTARSPNPFAPPPPDLSEISSAEKAGNDFMRVVFDELNVGDVGVAPNADQSVFYVVQVKSRSGSSPGGQAAARDRFMSAKLFPQEFRFMNQTQRLPTTYTYLTDNTRAATFNRWQQQLLKKYKYKRSTK